MFGQLLVFEGSVAGIPTGSDQAEHLEVSEHPGAVEVLCTSHSLTSRQPDRHI
jgi:hypothetical protein